VHGDAQLPGQPGAGPAGQLQAEPGEQLRQRDAPPAVPAGQAVRLHGERDLRAGRVNAQEPQHPHDDQPRAAPGRAVGHGTGVPAVHPRRRRPAGRAAPRRGRARRGDHHRVPGVLHPVHPQPSQLRKQQRQQLLALLRDVQDEGGGRRADGRHGRLGRQRGSRKEQVPWRTPASCRSLVARSRRHASTSRIVTTPEIPPRCPAGTRPASPAVNDHGIRGRTSFGERHQRAAGRAPRPSGWGDAT
jgi:hypothetical protein